MRGRRRERLLELDEVERRLKPFGAGTSASARSARRARRHGRPRRRFHARLPPAARLQPRPDALAPGRVRRRRLPADRDGQARRDLLRDRRSPPRGPCAARRRRYDRRRRDRLIARVPLPAGADMLEVVLRELERIFLEDSGLAEARPGVRIAVSRPARYLELLENIQVHGYHRCRDSDACSKTRRSRRTVRRDLPADARRDRAPAAQPHLRGLAARRPVPRPPSAPARRVPDDRLPAPLADGGLGDRRRRAAPPAAVPRPRLIRFRPFAVPVSGR